MRKNEKKAAVLASLTLSLLGFLYVGCFIFSERVYPKDPMWENAVWATIVMAGIFAGIGVLIVVIAGLVECWVSLKKWYTKLLDKRSNR